MVIFKSQQKKLEGVLKVKLGGKRLYPTASVKYLGVKLIQTLVRNIRLMIFLLNWTESMLSFSKWENMLVVKY